MSEPSYAIHITAEPDGAYVGQAYCGGQYITGSTHRSTDRDEVESALRQFVEWYRSGKRTVEVIEL